MYGNMQCMPNAIVCSMSLQPLHVLQHVQCKRIMCSMNPKALQHWQDAGPLGILCINEYSKQLNHQKHA